VRGDQLHAAREVARGQAHERDAIAVLGIHVRLDLEDEARHLGLAGLDGALDRGCGRGGGASSAMPAKSSRTPKLLTAEPKNTGVMWPSR
jgi:hypothetical protein